MATYYRITHSLNLKIIGKFPQATKTIQPCSMDDPQFIDNFTFKRSATRPLMSIAILEKKSKLTDLVNTAGMVGFNGKLLVSDKLKNLLEESESFGMEYFDTNLVDKSLEKEIFGYWLINPYESAYRFIDFPKSELVLVNLKDFSERVVAPTHEISADNFPSKRQFYWDRGEGVLVISRIHIDESTTADFFCIRHTASSGPFCVSEKLKKKIEEAGCTGIEFWPLTMTSREFMEHRKDVY
jgi:hypothetical protein